MRGPPASSRGDLPGLRRAGPDHDSSGPRGDGSQLHRDRPRGRRALVRSVPYVVALVSLDAAPELRVVGNLLDVAIDDVAIGLAVEAVWLERTDPDRDEVIRLPQWRARTGRP